MVGGETTASYSVSAVPSSAWSVSFGFLDDDGASPERHEGNLTHSLFVRQDR